MSFLKIITTASLLVCVCLCTPGVAGAFQAAVPPPKKKKLTLIEMQREQLQANLDIRQSTSKKLRDSILKQQKQLDSMNISQSAFDEVIKVLQTKRINLMIELAGLEVRQKEAKKLAAAGGDNQNNLVQQLEIMVNTEKARVKRLENLYKTGALEQHKLSVAKQLLAHGEVKLAEALDGAEHPHAANQMLVEASLAKAERLAQLDMVNNLLEKYVGSARNVISDIKMKREKLDSLTQALRQDSRELMKIDNELKLQKRFMEQDQSEEDH